MKNTHIQNLSEEVPADIRLQVYREAKKYLTTLIGTHNPTRGLCLVLPMKLWGLKTMLDPVPDGYFWKCDDTPIAFPELTEEILEALEEAYDTENADGVLKMRIGYLEQWIKDLESDGDQG